MMSSNIRERFDLATTVGVGDCSRRPTNSPTFFCMMFECRRVNHFLTVDLTSAAKWNVIFETKKLGESSGTPRKAGISPIPME